MNSAKKIMNQKNKAENKEDVVVKPASSMNTLGSTGESGSSIKPIILGVLCVVVVLVLCIGVGIQQLKPENVMKVNGTKFSMDNMMYPIYEKESQNLPMNEMYQYYMGTTVWDASYQGDNKNVDEGATNAEGFKQEIIDSETEYEILYQEAKKAGMELTADEKKKADDEALDAIKGLSWGQKLQLGVSKGKIKTRFEKRALADKYKDSKQEELNKEVDEKAAIADISSKDYRQYDVDYYYASLSKTDDEGNSTPLSDDDKKKLEKEMEKLAADAAAAKDFSKLIKDEEKTDIQYNSGNFTEKSGWSFVSESNLKKIKSMKNNEISEVFLDEEAGYYVFVKMIDNNSTESYESACDSAIKEAQDAKYDEWYTALKDGYKIEINDEIWDTVVIGTVTTGIVTAEDLSAMNEEASSETTSESK